MYYVLSLLRVGLIPDSRFEYTKKNSSAEFSVEEFSFISPSLTTCCNGCFQVSICLWAWGFLPDSLWG